jgi:hypothetical protein
VTLTSPTTFPTQVGVNGSVRFQSSELTPFDQTASASRGDDPFLGGSVTAHLTLNVTAEEILSTLDASTYGPNAGGWGARFSLDIVVDVVTPFVFEARLLASGGNNIYGYYYSNSKYRLYTPDSNDLDVSFAVTKFFTSAGGNATGFLVPDKTYRLEFENSGAGGIYRTGGGGGAAGQSTAILVLPEPSSGTLLVVGTGLCVPFRRHRFGLR